MPDADSRRQRPVTGGKPAGGPEHVVLKSGAPARIVVSTRDTTSEVHLHGYDIERKMAPGRPARLSFVAKPEGIFTLGLHPSEAELTTVEVRP